MQGSVEAKVKELLGGALEHLFNRDEGTSFTIQRQFTRTW